MYEPMRPRARSSSQIAGASVTVLIVALTGYVLTTGIAVPIVEAITGPMVVATLPETPPVPTEPPRAFEDIDLQETLAPPIPFVPEDIRFYSDEPSPILVEPGPAVKDPDPSIAAPAIPKPAPITPRLRPSEAPPYPAAGIRGNQQGITGLSVCIDARGRVTQARVTETSGHAVLDTAALKWVRDARFTPGSLAGSPQAVCDHPVFYEWKLEGRNR